MCCIAKLHYAMLYYAMLYYAMLHYAGGGGRYSILLAAEAGGKG